MSDCHPCLAQSIRSVATILAVFSPLFSVFFFPYILQNNMLRLLFPNLPTLNIIYCLPAGVSKELAALQAQPTQGIWCTIIR